MRSILIISHGTMAKGVYQATKMIYGSLNDVHYLCLEEEMGIEDFRNKLDKLINTISVSDEIIVLADLQGGSPYTAAATLLSEKGLLSKCKLISGLNLPMLLSVLFIHEKIAHKEVEEIINSAKEGISEFKVETNEDDIL